MGNDPYFGILIPEVTSDQSSSTDVIHTIVPPDHQVFEHNSKWTKDHPLENIIGDLDRPVSTRLQLHEQALFCYYDAFLTSVEPKNYKDALTQACWIEAMQEELHEFERLKVWELVPPPDKAFVITLKWVYKVKLDELGGILKKGSVCRSWLSSTSWIALDDALVAPANRLKIGKCNLRLSLDVTSKEATLQVVYDMLKLTPFYKAFQVSADVPEIYMQDNKKFEEPPLEKEILAFLASLGHSGEIRKITDVNVNKLHQPWRSFAAIINKCLSGKTCNTPKLGRSGIWVRGVLLHRSITQDIYRTTKKSFENDTLDCESHE
ncbi:retrovirus-related pol polyprotein from transposon TNT 1-94 [Tanacetum coccineum]